MAQANGSSSSKIWPYYSVRSNVILTPLEVVSMFQLRYCMPYTRHLLQSLEVPVVTQTRASDDYTAGNTQWRIGDTSILDHAVGLAPFKDVRRHHIDTLPELLFIMTGMV